MDININSAVSVSLEDLNFRFPAIARRKNLQNGIDEIKSVLLLSDGEYALKNKKCLGKIWGGIDYQIQHASAITNIESLQILQGSIAAALDEMDKTKIEGETLLQAILKYSDLQGEILTVIGKSKNRILEANEFTEDMLITDSMIYENPNIGKNLTDRHTRIHAIDTVLNILFSTNIVLMGRFSNNRMGGDLDYFYFDMGLFSDNSFSLISKIKRSSAFHKKIPSLGQILTQLQKFYQNQMISYYSSGMQELLTQFSALKKEYYALSSSSYNIFQEEKVYIDKFVQLTKRFEEMKSDYIADSKSFITGRELNELHKHLLLAISEIDKIQTGLPKALTDYFLRLRTSDEIFKINDESHELFVFSMNAINIYEDRKQKIKLLNNIIKTFITVFNANIAQYHLSLEKTVDSSGVDDYVIYWQDYYICYVPGDNAYYIYNKDHSEEISLKKSLFASATFKKNQVRFELMQKSIISFKTIFSIYDKFSEIF